MLGAAARGAGPGFSPYADHQSGPRGSAASRHKRSSEYFYPISKIKANPAGQGACRERVFIAMKPYGLHGLDKEPNMSSPNASNYTCQDFRMEMTILGLRRRLQDPHLSPEERREILDRLRRLEAEAGMD